MNLTLHNVIQIDSLNEIRKGEGEREGDNKEKENVFLKLLEIYIRGIHIKYLRIPDDIMKYAKEQNMINMENRNRYQKRRGVGGVGGGVGGINDSRRFNNNRQQGHGHNYGRR